MAAMVQPDRQTGRRLWARLVLLAAGLAGASEAQAAGGYTKWKSITIDRSKVGNGGAPATLANYPMLFSVTNMDLRTTANGGDVTDPQGDDIIFRAFNTTTCGGPVGCTLDHEIEEYVATTGELVAWVRIPALNTISAASDTVIYIFYSNTDVTSSTQNPTGVWDSNFEAVWHMNQDWSVSSDCSGGAGTKEVCDSTANNHDADAFGTLSSGFIDGKVGKALDFNGSNNGLTVSSPNLPTGDFTYSAWIRLDGAPASRKISFMPRIAEATTTH